MEINKLYSYKSEKQIWRILISGSDKLILETRDLNTKEVFFNCCFIENGKNIFLDLQLDEKCWIGIEEVYKDIIFFHHFPKPDMPHHKGIIAFDISAQKILWTNNEFSFLFAGDNKVYGFKQGFEERFFSSLDYLNGGLIEDFGSDHKRINALQKSAENEKDWNNYIYPQILKEENCSKIILKLISVQTHELDVVGETEYNLYNELLLFNFHSKNSGGLLTNIFCAVNFKDESPVLTKILNADAKSLFTDSFFVYKNFLFLLCGKNEVIVYKIE